MQRKASDLPDAATLGADAAQRALARLDARKPKTCEVPVISSDAGGLPELNIDGETGFVCAVGDVDAMTEKALFVLHPDRLPTFKKNALARAQHFDMSAIVPQYETLYERVVQNSPPTVVSDTPTG